MIRIDDNWHIETDAYCFKLVHLFPGKTKDGKTATTHHETYHPTLKKCLVWYCNEVTKDCTNIKAVIQKIDDLNAKIEKL